MKVRYLLKNAKFFSQGVFHLADVFLSDGKIVSIGDGVSPSNDTIVIDISNMVLFPGFVDVHVHLREPGFSYKETIRSGTLAAAHGGFAHIAAMPNLNPVPDCAESLALQRALIEKDALVHVHPYGAITVGEKGERLADLAGMAPDVIAFSDDGRGVQSESMMRQAMAECRHLGKILAAHCEATPCFAVVTSTTARMPRAPRAPRYLRGERVGADHTRREACRGNGLRLPRLPRFDQGKRRGHPRGQAPRRGRDMRNSAALSRLHAGRFTGGRTL